MNVNDSEEAPICPHCEEEIAEIFKKETSALAPHVVYFCSKCKKILGITQVGR